jgi:hypothetical protein
MNQNIYDRGDRIRIYTSTVFQDKDGTAFDPDTVTFLVKNPAGTVANYIYGTDVEVIKETVGNYVLTIDLHDSGPWYYRIEGKSATGQNRGAAENVFVVRKSTVI